MKEYEIKIPIKKEEVKSIKEKIAGKGFIFDKKVEEVDYYFNHPCRNFKDTDEALRIRCRGNDIILTYKGPKEGNRGKVRKEFNVYCNSNEISSILKSLNFVEYGVVRKEREYYKKDGITITIDNVSGLGYFVEIEVEKDLWDRIDKIKEDIGLSGRYEERLSYLELLKGKK